MVNPIQCNRQTTTKGLITMFGEINSKELQGFVSRIIYVWFYATVLQ